MTTKLHAIRQGSPLTPREREILVEITRGLSNKQIAKALGLSPHTVACYVRVIGARLGFRSRILAAVWAVRQGIA